MAEAPARPSRTRHFVLGLLVLLYGLTYLDRVCISAAAPALQEEFGFDESVKGLIFSAFNLSYALFQIPTGWLADRIGAKRVLSILVAWWSLFTAATGAAWNAVSLIVIRFLFGMGEAGAFPTASRAMARWMPIRESQRRRVGKDSRRPRGEPSTGDTDFPLAGGVVESEPLGALHGLRLLCLCLTFFLFWTPSFWKQAHGASLMVASSLSGILLFFGAITNAVGG